MQALFFSKEDNHSNISAFDEGYTEDYNESWKITREKMEKLNRKSEISSIL